MRFMYFTVSYLDEFTVDKLERIEKRLPILTKSTDEAKRDVENAYNDRLAPTVNRISAATWSVARCYKT